MRKTLIAMLAAVAVLVIGGSVTAVAQSDDVPTDVAWGGFHARGPMLEELLEEMVTDGVITPEQSTTISEWLTTRHEVKRAEREATREGHIAAWEDGVLTRDEVDALGLDGRMAAEDGPLAEAWEDGQLTRDEVRAARPERPFRHRTFTPEAP